ncbi:hypothetical protein EOA19_29655 [Mesorhizobium sp. M7A.F.Ca.US.010.02.1.1]|nr:hypothetical protein EOA19_29655 [Mesorhizobium sp. M7A.F.Ca.US.010.02.1.1]
MLVALFLRCGDWRKQDGQPISPLAGEMSGRTEGGAVPPALPIGRSPPNRPTSSRQSSPPCRDCPCR